jgi:uncharacterized damage-inducible protein DinB
MRLSDLQRLYDCHSWATRQLMAVIAQLSPDHFTQPVAES